MVNVTNARLATTDIEILMREIETYDGGDVFSIFFYFIFLSIVLRVRSEGGDFGEVKAQRLFTLKYLKCIRRADVIQIQCLLIDLM